jgi:hypothetical protein
MKFGKSCGKPRNRHVYKRPRPGDGRQLSTSGSITAPTPCEDKIGNTIVSQTVAHLTRGLHRELKPIQQLRFFTAMVRDQEVEGSNPFAPTTSQRSLACPPTKLISGVRASFAGWTQGIDEMHESLPTRSLSFCLVWEICG